MTARLTLALAGLALAASLMDEAEAGTSSGGVAGIEGKVIDGDPAPFLLFPTVGVHAGQRLDQRGLAVVDVTGGADYEATGWA